MDARTLAQLLGKLRFSASLPPDVLQRLAKSATLDGFAAGTVLFREGTQNDRLMIVTVGSVALDMKVPGRGDVRILTMGPGDMVAWSALLGGGHMTATATALEDTQVVSISAADVQAICQSNHEIGYHVMRQMGRALAERLIATRLQLLDLFSETHSGLPLETHMQ